MANSKPLSIDEILTVNDSLVVTLKFWEMKGLTLTQVEDTYNFDFVVTDDCEPVISNGQFVIVER